jgi:hypothetical protein
MMAAPKGNQYALGNDGGRPTLYDDKYCKDIIDYFSKPAVNVGYKKEYNKDGSLKCEIPFELAAQYPTLQRYAHNVGVCHSTLLDWCKHNKEFAQAYARAKQLQEDIVLTNGMSNQFNSQFAQFILKNHFNYKDKTEVEQNTTIQISLANDLKYLGD